MELRLLNPEFYTMGRLGQIFDLNKKTVADIFERDKDRYAEG